MIEKPNYKPFFEKHVLEIRSTNAKCVECGCKLSGRFSEVAHVLPKQYFKSISTDDDNVIYLCDQFTDSNCHAKYDNSSNEVVKNMKIFTVVSEKFEKLLEKITENLNYKHYDRWQA